MSGYLVFNPPIIAIVLNVSGKIHTNPKVKYQCQTFNSSTKLGSAIGASEGNIVSCIHKSCSGSECMCIAVFNQLITCDDSSQLGSIFSPVDSLAPPYNFVYASKDSLFSISSTVEGSIRIENASRLTGFYQLRSEYFLILI